MLNVTAKIANAASFISDHGNAAASKFMTYFGAGGAGVGVVSGVTQKYAEPDFLWFNLTEWGALVGIVGGLMLAIKAGVDIYFAFKRDKRETKAHKRGE